jgi:hypothetical protein
MTWRQRDKNFRHISGQLSNVRLNKCQMQF